MAGVALDDQHLTVFDVRFDAPPIEHLPGYPAERVRVTMTSDALVLTVPIADNARCWLHRYADYALRKVIPDPQTTPIGWENLLGALCLWYPHDPPHLRWSWMDGIDAYLRIVQRHLWSEEYWRRHGEWPAEDAPHGDRPDGQPHPILTPALWSSS